MRFCVFILNKIYTYTQKKEGKTLFQNIDCQTCNIHVEYGRVLNMLKTSLMLPNYEVTFVEYSTLFRHVWKFTHTKQIRDKIETLVLVLTGSTWGS